MEYKTFQQRLMDSIREVWPRQRRYSEFSSDMEPEFDHSGRIGGAFDNREQSPIAADVENENNATTSAANGNATIDSNLRYNSLT